MGLFREIVGPCDLAILLAEARFPFEEIPGPVLEHWELPLAESVDTALSAIRQMRDVPAPTSRQTQQAVGAALTAALARKPDLTVEPPVPVVASGRQPLWMRPLFDPAMTNAQLTFVRADGQNALVANTGNWLTFLDPVDGAVTAVVEGDRWMPAVVAGGLIYANDGGAKGLVALRPDATEAWRAALPRGELAASGGRVFHRSVADGTITGLDALTGVTIWQSPTQNGVVPAQPGIAAGAGRVVFRGNGPDVAVYALDEQTGKAAWTWTATGEWEGSHWVEGPLTVTSDGVVLAPLLPMIAALSAAEGTVYSGLIGKSQSTTTMEWAIDAGRSLAVVGWDSTVACLLDYRHPGQVAFFPSFKVTVYPPDPGINGPAQPRLWNGNLVVTFLANGGQTEVYLVNLTDPPLRLDENDYPGERLFAISGAPFSPQVDDKSLYVLLGTGAQDEWSSKTKYVAALPLP